MPPTKKHQPLKTYIFVILFGILTTFSLMMVLTQKRTAKDNTHKIISGAFDQNTLKTDVEWRKILTPEQFYILREQGTETPYTGELLHNSQKGTYVSAGCNMPVFRSEQKYDSGTGWPSFTAPINSNAVVLREDTSIGEKRIEVLDTCGGHLGHLFNDGPQPSGTRYCINSAALIFIPDKE